MGSKKPIAVSCIDCNQQLITKILVPIELKSSVSDFLTLLTTRLTVAMKSDYNVCQLIIDDGIVLKEDILSDVYATESKVTAICEERGKLKMKLKVTTGELEKLFRELKDFAIEGSSLNPHFQDIKTAQRLGFANCYRAEYRKSTRVFPVVVKAQNEDVNLNLLVELKKLIQLQHLSIVRAFGFCSLSTKETALVFEYAEKGSLRNVLENNTKYPDDELQWKIRLNILSQIADGLNFLHEQTPPIIHRDLKSRNILIRQNWSACLADFEISKSTLESKIRAIGTPRWMAPEVWARQNYDVKADVWSFGMVMYEMYTREIPSQDFVFSAHRGDKLKISAEKECPPGFKELMSECLQLNSNDRPSCKTILKKLKKLSLCFETYSVETPSIFYSTKECNFKGKKRGKAAGQGTR